MNLSPGYAKGEIGPRGGVADRTKGRGKQKLNKRAGRIVRFSFFSSPKPLNEMSGLKEGREKSDKKGESREKVQREIAPQNAGQRRPETPAGWWERPGCGTTCSGRRRRRKARSRPVSGSEGPEAGKMSQFWDVFFFGAAAGSPALVSK